MKSKQRRGINGPICFLLFLSFFHKISMGGLKKFFFVAVLLNIKPSRGWRGGGLKAFNGLFSL